MFAVFSFTGGALLNDGSDTADTVTGNWRSGNDAAIQATDEKIAALQEQRAGPDLSPDERAEIDRQIAELESSRAVMEALASGDWARLAELDELDQPQKNTRQDDPAQDPQLGLDWPALEHKLTEGLKQVNSNPSLLLYKLKTNGYKFSWALIPLSLPFLWLLFFWRRDIHLYDHAIFVTYSISFMMLLLVLCSLAAVAGVSSSIWATALVFAPPIHMYRQLRGAYGLSRFGALLRLFFLLIATSVVLTLFTLLLLLIGVLG